MHVSTRAILGALSLFLLPAARVAAAPPETAVLIAKMRAVVWPAQPSFRTLTITVTADQGDKVTWVARQARTRVAGGGRMLTVLQTPADLRGTAWLVQEGPDQTVQWVWEPFIRRVRKLIPVEGHQAFLSSDFTYADLGVVDLHSTTKLLGEETHNGVRAYQVEEVPRSHWYYTRIVDWIAADTFFPLQRDFYDPSNVLWKVETFDQVTEINGVPTVLRRRMADRQTGSTTQIDVSEVRYGVDLADNLFDPTQLPRAIDASPAWK